MADPTNKSYDGIISWAKASDNDIKAKQLATPRSITITNNGGTSVVATAGSFDGTGNATIKLKDPVAINVTGNVTGNCSGSSGSCTGNAATASAVKASRTTYSGNRPLAIAYIDGITTTTDVTKAVLYSNNFYANPNTGVLTATGGFNGDLTGNAATATKLKTTRTVSLTGDVTGSGNFDGSANLSISTTMAVAGVPTGTILPFLGTSAPAGFLLCNGAQVSKTTYANLWNYLSSAFDTFFEVSTTKFRLPDLRGRYIQYPRSGQENFIGYPRDPTLPEIEGHFKAPDNQAPDNTGAFYIDDSSSRWSTNYAWGHDDKWGAIVSFKASRSNTVYGGSDSDKVRPYTFCAAYIIKY